MLPKLSGSTFNFDATKALNMCQAGGCGDMVCVADLVDVCSLIWISGDGGKNWIMALTSLPV